MRPEFDEPAADSGDLREARPAVDRAGMEAVRARAEQALFGEAPPARLGRYVVLDHLAGGGMGVVYRGYDPDLHRKVALKVLHPRQHGDDRAHARMLAEARALAKLDHVNVVKIHDVLSLDGEVVLVMELAEGVTLAAWERAQARSWRDVVDVYAQAAQGLAAAHSVGVVHRDFKPANAVLGSDGRVRVLDFGLARDLASTATEPFAAGSPGVAPPDDLTATGEVVGTLGYTSPEQLAGELATPASDQFSFAVSLHRALEGVPPFTGTDAASLERAIRAGRIDRSPDRAVPAWLRALIIRALAAAPTARFPAMTGVVEELRRPRGLLRWRVPLAATGLILIAVAAVATRPARSASLDPCDGGAADINPVWAGSPRELFTGAFAGSDSLSIQPAKDARIEASLDRYRSRWLNLRRDSCHARTLRTASEDLLDRQMLCLNDRRAGLRASIQVLQELPGNDITRALEVVAHLPDLEICGDYEALRADNAPPATALQSSQVATARTAIGRAAALDHAGRSDEALASITQTLASARTIGYPALVAEAALQRGRTLLTRRDFANAGPQLSEARTLGLQNRLLPIAVEAAARSIYVEAMTHVDLEALAREATIIEPLADNLPGDHFAEPLLLNNLGTAYMSVGMPSVAEKYFLRAQAALGNFDNPDIELSCISMNLAMVSRDETQRAHLTERVWAQRNSVLGATHLDTIEALFVHAGFSTSAKALALCTLACAAYDSYAPNLIDQRAFCKSYQGALYEHFGFTTMAIATYNDIKTLTSTASDSELSSLGRLADGRSRLLAKDFTGSISVLKPIADNDSPHQDWWIRAQSAEANLGIGTAEGALGHARIGQQRIRDALAIYTNIVAISGNKQHRLRMQQAERALAPR